MLDIDKQYVFNEHGKAIAVQIPLDQFEQIERLLGDVSETRSQEETESDQEAVEYVNGVLVIKSQGGKIPASIVDDMREQRIRELEADWAAEQETLYLLSVPGMRELIRGGLATPVEECDRELEW